MTGKQFQGHEIEKFSHINPLKHNDSHPGIGEERGGEREEGGT